MTQLPVPAASRPRLATSLFDSMDLGAVDVPPLVPADILDKHKVLVPTDQRFRSAARFLQALWREDRGLPIGSYVNGEDRRVRLGSRISAGAGRNGGNFLSPDIASLVRRECAFREIGALIEVERLRENLLSSMPLTFNLFGPLKLDLRDATRFIAELFPGAMAECTAVRFEHSPGRGDIRFTADYSAFDVTFYGRSATGARCFIALEVKYSEAGQEPQPERFSYRHAVIAEAAGLLIENEDPTVSLNPVQQLHREHCLAQSMLDNDIAEQGLFVLVAPSLNHLAMEMGRAYASKLAPARSGQVPFATVTLERCIESLAMIGLPTHAQALYRRYCDFRLIEGELDLESESHGTSRQRAPAA